MASKIKMASKIMSYWTKDQSSGITATMERPEFVMLSIPSEEQWSDSLRWITREQQERFATAEFFTMLQMQITGRYLRLPQRSPPK